jgi:hypothetical protein
MTSRITNLWKKSASASKSDDSSVLEEDIQALRTMITMLYLIQQGKQSNSDLPVNISETPNPPPATDEQYKELKILSALATVLVMEHDVVAVVAKPGNARDSEGSVEVLACTDSIVEGKSSNPDSNILGSILKHFLVTSNPRRLKKPSKKPNIYPTICNPKNSSHHPQDVTLNNLQEDVRKNW